MNLSSFALLATESDFFNKAISNSEPELLCPAGGKRCCELLASSRFLAISRCILRRRQQQQIGIAIRKGMRTPMMIDSGDPAFACAGSESSGLSSFNPLSFDVMKNDD